MEEIYHFIKSQCMSSNEQDPIILLQTIMRQSAINMHGPEHHMLDGACLMTALHNLGMQFDLSTALDELISRARKMPGATCGHWGMCGSAASIGAALSIIRKTGPLSNNIYYQDNMHCVCAILDQIANIGGPRCCKRNAFLAIETASIFLEKQYGIHLPHSTIACEFSFLRICNVLVLNVLIISFNIRSERQYHSVQPFWTCIDIFA